MAAFFSEHRALAPPLVGTEYSAHRLTHPSNPRSPAWLLISGSNQFLRPAS